MRVRTLTAPCLCDMSYKRSRTILKKAHASRTCGADDELLPEAETDMQVEAEAPMKAEAEVAGPT